MSIDLWLYGRCQNTAFLNPRIRATLFRFSGVALECATPFPFPNPCSSVVICAAQVVAAVGADQLALVARQAVRAVGADLAMVVDRRLLGGFCSDGANHTTL